MRVPKRLVSVAEVIEDCRWWKIVHAKLPYRYNGTRYVTQYACTATKPCDYKNGDPRIGGEEEMSSAPKEKLSMKLLDAFSRGNVTDFTEILNEVRSLERCLSKVEKELDNPPMYFSALDYETREEIDIYPLCEVRDFMDRMKMALGEAKV